jgi:uncharacterized protein (TIGR03067 family)
MNGDLALLQGFWTVTSLNVEGQKMSKATLQGSSIAIRGNRFTTTGKGSIYEGVLELEASKRPPWLNMKFDAGPEKGYTNLGIYQLYVDTWRICFATRGLVRPSRFAAPADSGFVLETLARAVAPPTRNAPRTRKALPPIAIKAPGSSTSSSTIFEGDWSMISGVMNGCPMDDTLLQWVRRETRGNRTTVYAGPQIMLKVDFTSESPQAIDYLNLVGAHKGKPQAGIYKPEGNLLTVCIAAPDGKGPAVARFWKRI